MAKNPVPQLPEEQEENFNPRESLPGIVFSGIILAITLGGSIWLFIASF